MTTYIFDVHDQCIKDRGGVLLVSGSSELYVLDFVFDDTWFGYAKTAVFESNGVRRECLLQSDRCVVPWEVLIKGAAVRVGVYGVLENTLKPTVYSGFFHVLEGAEPSEEAREHSPDVFDQIVTIGARAELAAQRAEAAAGLRTYLSLVRRAAYLFEVSYGAVPEDAQIETLAIGGCSSYVRAGKLHRNFDLSYTEDATFLLHCSGFDGTAKLPGLTDTELDPDLIGQLPYHLVDGVNSHGIMVSAHLLFNDWDWVGQGATPLTKVPYLVMTKVKSMDTIADDLADVLPNLRLTAALTDGEYLMQFLVSDGIKTVAILPPEASIGSYVIVDISSNAKLTNFRWVPDAVVSRDMLQTRPTGVERWNAMPASLLSQLRFTAAYEAPTRLSEFIGIDGTTKDSSDETLTSIYDRAAAAYVTRVRDGKTWQTMHSAVYAPTGLENLWVQEDWSRDYVRCSPHLNI